MRIISIFICIINEILKNDTFEEIPMTWIKQLDTCDRNEISTRKDFLHLL